MSLRHAPPPLASQGCFAVRKAHRACVAIALCLVSVSACTTRGTYEAIRQNERNECYRKPSDSERAACLERTQDDYDTYQRKRASVIRDH
jgi:hypothetical protein